MWDRIPLRGTATLDGSPFTGAISFRPAAGNRGPSAMTKVDDGQFKFDRQGGPVAGANTAILIPPPREDRMAANRVSMQADLPTSAPYTVDLSFHRTQDEPEPETRPQVQPETGTEK